MYMWDGAVKRVDQKPSTPTSTPRWFDGVMIIINRVYKPNRRGQALSVQKSLFKTKQPLLLILWYKPSVSRKASNKPVKSRYYIISLSSSNQLADHCNIVVDGCTGRQLHPLLPCKLLIISNYCVLLSTQSFLSVPSSTVGNVKSVCEDVCL